jgi:hypothetical protein
LILLLSVSWVARITGVNHQHPALLGLCLKSFAKFLSRDRCF